MALLLCRIDDRLVHGQVVIGWGRPLDADRIVLVDDEVAGNEWEQDLYRMAVPEGVEIIFASLATATAHLAEWSTDQHRALLLTGDVPTMAALFAADRRAVTHINLGGVHHRPGRTERLPYLYLTDDERALLQRLVADGAGVSAQDVPSAAPISLGALP
ncbi:MAG: PTS sugar transporter subunit IIB [Gemmatimonadales bacterium]|nr:PTS sugar transporter subunit IIB [Gemmatimonadales bacterium]